MVLELEIYQIDAFTSEVFKGNPACVVPLNEWLDDKLLIKIARENNVSETAFFVKNKNGFHIRWFTPDIEMDLCGHATLASAYCLKRYLNYQDDEILFYSKSGTIKSKFIKDKIELELPLREPEKTKIPETLLNAINYKPVEVLKARDFILVFDSQLKIENIKIKRSEFDKINIDPGGVAFTSKGNDCDFVSRFFTPQSSIFEDSVTGSSHCSLVPYWSRKLNKKKLKSIQLSQRTGILECEAHKKYISVSGNAIIYLKGKIFI